MWTPLRGLRGLSYMDPAYVDSPTWSPLRGPYVDSLTWTLLTWTLSTWSPWLCGLRGLSLRGPWTYVDPGYVDLLSYVEPPTWSWTLPMWTPWTLLMWTPLRGALYVDSPTWTLVMWTPYVEPPTWTLLRTLWTPLRGAPYVDSPTWTLLM